jgi:hypothetical protein
MRRLHWFRLPFSSATILSALLLCVTLYIWAASCTGAEPNFFNDFHFGKPGDQTLLCVFAGRTVYMHSNGVARWPRDTWERGNPYHVSYYRRIGKWIRLWYSTNHTPIGEQGYVTTTFVAVPLWIIAVATSVLPTIWLLRRRWRWSRSWGGRGFDVVAGDKGSGTR